MDTLELFENALKDNDSIFKKYTIRSNDIESFINQMEINIKYHGREQILAEIFLNALYPEEEIIFADRSTSSEFVETTNNNHCDTESNNKDYHVMSFMSKALFGICLILFIATCIFVYKNVDAIPDSVPTPIAEFLEKHTDNLPLSKVIAYRIDYLFSIYRFTIDLKVH